MDYHIVSDKTDMVDMDMDHSMVGKDKMDVGVGLKKRLPKSLLVIHQQMVQQKIPSDHSVGVGFDIHALALPPLIFIPFKQDCI